MTYLLKIRRERVSLINDKNDEEVSLTDIVIDYEGGMVRGNYVWQAFLDHQHPERPNRFSVARKLGKYKPKINKYG